MERSSYLINRRYRLGIRLAVMSFTFAVAAGTQRCGMGVVAFDKSAAPAFVEYPVSILCALLAEPSIASEFYAAGPRRSIDVVYTSSARAGTLGSPAWQRAEDLVERTANAQKNRSFLIARDVVDISQIKPR